MPCSRLPAALLLLFSFFIISPVFSAEFNIKLRKTDINELRQQLMPAFEQNIMYLQQLLSCLESGRQLDKCLNEYARTVDDREGTDAEKQVRNAQLKQKIDHALVDKEIKSEQIIPELKKLLVEAEAIKLCLYHGKTANDLKDCIVKP